MFVPLKNAEPLRKAIGLAGGGSLGNYTFCSYSITGKGRFKPGNGANPYIGSVGTLESVQEERIEVTCNQEQANQVIKAIKSVHPYEEVALDIYPLLSEDEL